MAADVRVRPATDEDLPAIRELMDLLDDLQRDWRVYPPREGFQDEVIERYRSQAASGESVHLVAEVDGEVVGTAFGHEKVISAFSDARAFEVSSVVVRPELRGRGIARALLRALAEEAGRRGIGHLSLATFVQNKEAMRFWERAGFAPRYVQLAARTEEILARSDESLDQAAERE